MAIGTIILACHCLTVSGDIFPHGDVRQPAGRDPILVGAEEDLSL